MEAVGIQFCKMAYKSGWILQDFDWPSWSHGPEGKRFLGNREAIASATCQQLRKILTTLIRQDRFVEGGLAEAYKDKTLLAIVERAEALTRARTATKRKRVSKPSIIRESTKSK